MSAYLVRQRGDDRFDDLDWYVTFAESPDAIKVDAEEWEIERRKELDKYEGSGFGTREMVSEGWNVPCLWCDQNVNDEYDSDGELRPKTDEVCYSSENKKAHAFCSEQCRTKQQDRWAAIKAQKELTLTVAAQKLPEGFVVAYVSGGTRAGGCTCESPEYPGYISFTFPGSIGKAHGCPHCDTWFAARQDTVAWREWVNIGHARNPSQARSNAN